MPEIFVSYRRDDAAGTAGRLFDRLVQHFGHRQVFRDIESIEAGEAFEQVISGVLRDATAALVIIGPRWVTLRGTPGARRIDDPADPVRREVELALASDALVVPVLVDGAQLPAADTLPPTIRELVGRNAVDLTHRRWESDVGDLVKRLEACGIPALGRPGVRAAAAGLPGFVPDLVALLRRPRRFLGRRTRAGAAHLPQAALFYLLCLLLAAALLLAAYTPVQPAVGFMLVVIATGLLAAVVLSLPLWLAWRIAGARRHYAQLLVVLLYQMAVLHLAVLGFGAIVLAGVDLHGLNAMRDILGAVMAPGVSSGDAVTLMGEKLAQLAGASEVRVAVALGVPILAAGVAWTVWSWRAYRDAFGLSRARSIVAFGAAVAMAVAVSLLAR